MDKFWGYERKDGKVGIRNHVIVIPTVACANGVVRLISKEVPEIVPLYHQAGCGRETELKLHINVFANLGKNPNVAAVLLVGLGCEIMQGEPIYKLIADSGKDIEFIEIQKDGGSQKTAKKGIEIVKRMLKDAEKIERKEFSFDKLVLGLECGGSDALSGVTANPGAGLASDWVVAQGGTTIFSESPEMIGTAHILTKRAANPETAQKIRNIITGAEELAVKTLGEDCAKKSIAPGNMDGGMSTIQEKSLGCVRKGGSTTIMDVVGYGETTTCKGLNIMDGPGYDVENITGLASSGCQMIIFSTGRGTPAGHPIVPIIKVASNSRLYNFMNDDMDINAGVVVEGTSLQELGEHMVSYVKEVANGKLTKAEINDQGGMLCVKIISESL